MCLIFSASYWLNWWKIKLYKSNNINIRVVSTEKCHLKMISIKPSEVWSSISIWCISGRNSRNSTSGIKVIEADCIKACQQRMPVCLVDEREKQYRMPAMPSAIQPYSQPMSVADKTSATQHETLCMHFAPFYGSHVFYFSFKNIQKWQKVIQSYEFA